MTTFTIDCDSCPARGRMCGDCFVPVLGKIWLETPTARTTPGAGSGRSDPPEAELDQAVLDQAVLDYAGFDPAGLDSRSAALDSDELAAVSAFVRAGLVHPHEAAFARAEVTGGFAVG